MGGERLAGERRTRACLPRISSALKIRGAIFVLCRNFQVCLSRGVVSLVSSSLPVSSATARNVMKLRGIAPFRCRKAELILIVVSGGSARWSEGAAASSTGRAAAWRLHVCKRCMTTPLGARSELGRTSHTNMCQMCTHTGRAGFAAFRV